MARIGETQDFDSSHLCKRGGKVNMTNYLVVSVNGNGVDNNEDISNCAECHYPNCHFGK